MSGVIVADMETLIRNTELKIEDVSKCMSELRMASLELRRCIKSTDLSFLTSGLYEELTYLNNTLRKLNAFHAGLKKVLRAYTNQENSVASSVRRIS